MSRFFIQIANCHKNFAKHKLEGDYGFDPLEKYMMAKRAFTQIALLYVAFYASKNFCKKICIFLAAYLNMQYTPTIGG